MTGIVLSASVRQNLLSLQNTAQCSPPRRTISHRQQGQLRAGQPDQLLHRAALTGRAGDISNLLDGIGNGVQVLQAANTGITSLQSLVASAQSVANQVLQTPVGYDSSPASRLRRSRAPMSTTCSAPARAIPMRHSQVRLPPAPSRRPSPAPPQPAPRSATTTRRLPPSARPPSWSAPPAAPRTTSPQARSPMAPRWSSTARPSPSRPGPRRPRRVRPRPALPSVSAPAAPPPSRPS